MKQEYRLLEIGRRTHVLVSSDRNTNIYDKDEFGYTAKEKIPEANYMNTGMALCGILRQGESLENFLVRTNRTY